ncbi:MAG: anti-sigma factor family protein [Burkholderiaceae bacterium]
MIHDLPPDDGQALPEDDLLLIAAALDDELDAAASLALQRRLDAEPALKAAWDEQRALRATLRGHASYHAAPDELQARVARAITTGATPAPARPPAGASARRALRRHGIDAEFGAGFDDAARHAARRPWLWAAAGALVSCALTLAVVDPAALRRPGGPAAGALDEARAEAGEAVSAHTRALLVDHPIEVASSDQHTVRPWLSARLNFVPPVVDLAPQGFALVGARRDVLAGETAAALVYRHGAHVISVFVRPAAAAAAPRTLVVRGFNVIERTQGGMAFCFVSDANLHELAALADLLAPLKSSRDS